MILFKLILINRGKYKKNTGYVNYSNTNLPGEGDTFSNCQRFSFSGKAIR
jgi:hypothetical protein